tara:strand:- start:6306 stop:7535 length:1230 start_codon:yes stop_codon:yes gene_type:complete
MNHNAKSLLPLFFIIVSICAYSQNNSIKLFLKCSCDSNYIRDQINYIDYVRDQEDANIILEVYGDPNGNRGKYSIYLIGKKNFVGIDDELSFESHPKMTNDEIRSGLKDKIQIGILKYLVNTNDINDLNFSISKLKSNISDSDSLIVDKWKNWIFEVSASGYYEKESSRKTNDFNGRFEVNRFTEDWRIETTLRFFKRIEEFLSETDNFKSYRLYKGAYGKIVRSISDHWSTGIFYGFSEDSYENIKFSNNLSPAIEYSIFPYRDVVRREMVLEYKIGYRKNNYETKTIYGKNDEFLGIHSFAFKTRYRQNWGDIYSRFSFFTYLHDNSKNRLTFDNYLNIRIFEGFSLRLGAEIRFIRDQINLAAGQASIEDLLLQQRSIATDFYNEFRLGLTYTFGSAFNNIINTRL